jgi:multidrug efflux pump subunit AcrA (membrane-fusion protein)
VSARPAGVRLLGASTCLLAFTALGCGDASAEKQTRVPAAEHATHAPRAVHMIKVAAQALTHSIDVSGTLAADQQVTVGIKVPGRLGSIAIDLGSVVKRGQQIAEIEPTDYRLRVESAASALLQARALLGLSPEGEGVEVDVDATSLVREAKATFEEARANLERAQQLIAQRLIAQAEFDTAKAAFVRAQTGVAKAQDEIRNRQALLRQRAYELRAARQQLTDTVVRAPIDGVVQERRALAGEFLAAGAPVCTIVSVDPLRLRAEVPERDAPLVRAGQSVRVHVDGAPAEQIGRVVRLAPALSEQNRALMVEAELANPGTLRPGSFARAEIVVDDSDEANVVPTSAIVTFAGIEKVIQVEDGKAVEKEIEVGRRDVQWTEVVSGVAVGAEVVVDPGNLQQGQPVTIAGSR